LIANGDNAPLGTMQVALRSIADESDFMCAPFLHVRVKRSCRILMVDRMFENAMCLGSHEWISLVGLGAPLMSEGGMIFRREHDQPVTVGGSAPSLVILQQARSGDDRLAAIAAPGASAIGGGAQLGISSFEDYRPESFFRALGKHGEMTV